LGFLDSAFLYVGTRSLPARPARRMPESSIFQTLNTTFDRLVFRTSAV
jgi:hypothetical protein